MNKKQEENICKWLDKRFEYAIMTDKELGNEYGKNFLQSNPDYIYYKGACDLLLLAGYDTYRTNNKHYLSKLD